MSKKSIRQLIEEETPLLMPAVHDALSARLAELAGFRAVTVGGFALAGVRYALPDIGLTSFREAADGVRDLMMGTDLPVFVDADDGYGDVKNVTRTVLEYESMGVSGIMLEDQTSPKRCGHMAGKSVVDEDTACRKLEAALSARKSDDFWILARTDARAILGLDAAIRRAEKFQEVGVDAVFVEAPLNVEEMAIVGKSFKVPTVANIAEGGRTPILSPDELKALGFSVVVYPASILLRVVKGIQEGLDSIKSGNLVFPEGAVDFRELTSILGIEKWAGVDEGFGDIHAEVK